MADIITNVLDYPISVSIIESPSVNLTVNAAGIQGPPGSGIAVSVSGNISNLVYTSGNQIITGFKNFNTGISVSYISGESNYVGLIDTNNIVSMDWNNRIFYDLNSYPVIDYKNYIIGNNSGTFGSFTTIHGQVEFDGIQVTFSNFGGGLEINCPTLHRSDLDITDNVGKLIMGISPYATEVGFTGQEIQFPLGAKNGYYFQCDDNGYATWEPLKILDNSSGISIDYTGRLLKFSNGNSSLDWENTQLNDSTNSASILWGSRVLVGGSNKYSLEWNNRLLRDSNAVKCADWNNRLLQDTNESQSLDWQNRILKDSVQNYSIQYADRYLRNSAQDYVLDWDNRVLSGEWKSSVFNSYSGSFGNSNINLSKNNSVLNIGVGNNVESTTVGYDNNVPSNGISFYRYWIGTATGIEGGVYSYSTPNWGGGLYFQTKAGNGIQNGSGQTVIVLQSDANVLIGTGLATEKLQVIGNIKTSGLYTDKQNLTPSVNTTSITLSDKSFYSYKGTSTGILTFPTISSSAGRFILFKNKGMTCIATGGISSDNFFYFDQKPSFIINSGESYIFANDGEHWIID